MARVVVVEDKEENLDLMVYLLTSYGHEALVARNGHEGIVLIGQARPDLVLMDLQMPELDGYQAAAILKAEAELASIPLVAVTAYAMVGDRDAVLAAGFDGYMTKPIDPRTFVRDVERYLVTTRGAPPTQGARG